MKPDLTFKIFYTLFDTEIGNCAIAWKESGSNENLSVCAFQLPEETPDLTEMRIEKKSSAKKSSLIPKQIENIISNIQQHFKGKTRDFQEIALDLNGFSEFTKQIYAAARTIPPGKTLTYGQLAAKTGHPGAARAVGRAMATNPIPLIIPCHRVVASDGKLRGFSAYGGLKTKARMLQIEGSPVLT